MRATRIATVVSAIALALGIGAALGAYCSGGSSLIAVEVSPDGRERVELYTADRWQNLFHPNADLLGYAKLVTKADGETLGISEPFELSGHSEMVWGADRVQVATGAIFDRRTRRWTLLR